MIFNVENSIGWVNSDLDNYQSSVAKIDSQYQKMQNKKILI